MSAAVEKTTTRDIAPGRLTELEGVIERGLTTFVEVGEALREIRDSRLYRGHFSTFEDYSRERWGFTDRRARQLMQTAEIGTVVPVENERQARELGPLAGDEAALVDTWRELKAEHGESVTAAKVREAVTARLRREQVVKNVASSQSYEWYTPPEYIEAAREVLGGIDLDPASSRIANETVKAERYFTAADDGLAHDWPGLVWLNPPYGNLGPRFVARLREQYETGITTAAVLLVSAYSTETQWFQPLFAYPLCFARGRLAFYSPSEEASTPPFASAFAYLGPDGDRFARVFSEFGAVVTGHPACRERHLAVAA